MPEKKKAMPPNLAPKLDVGLNSGVEHWMREAADKDAHSARSHKHEKRDFEHEIEAMIAGAETPEHHGLISKLHLHSAHGTEPTCPLPSSPTASPIQKRPESIEIPTFVVCQESSEKKGKVEEFLGDDTLEEKFIPPHGLAPHRLESAVKEVNAYHPLGPDHHEPSRDYAEGSAATGGWPRGHISHPHPPFSPQESMRHTKDGEVLEGKLSI